MRQLRLIVTAIDKSFPFLHVYYRIRLICVTKSRHTLNIQSDPIHICVYVCVCVYAYIRIVHRNIYEIIAMMEYKIAR